MASNALSAASKVQRAGFWDSYYSSKTKPGLPSQFAAFVASELERDTTIIDIGCGHGRDSFFFSRHGFQVIGLDASLSAIEAAQAFADAHPSDHLQFRQYDLNDGGLDQIVAGCHGTVCIYARFFLHAIDDEEEAKLLRVLSESCRPGDLLAVEYRTELDEETDKQADPHYRRYVKPDDFDERVKLAGFTKRYGVAGRGFAKYKSEDAHVARAICAFVGRD